MKRVLTYGTYDLLHHGHINLLRRAKALGDYLVVGLSTDEFNSVKKKDSFLPFGQRMAVLQAIRFVDLVIPETNWEQKSSDIIDLKIDILVMGDDWQGRFDLFKDLCEVIYLPRTESISTSQIKSDLTARLSGSLN